MRYYLIICLGIFYACSNDKESVKNTSDTKKYSAEVADTNWRTEWENETADLENRLNKLELKLQKNGRRTAGQVDKQIIQLEQRRRSFDTSATSRQLKEDWAKFKLKTDRFIDSLNKKFTIE